MEKLKLKHLAPYLPYKLKGNYEVSEVVPSAKFELRNKELRTDNVDFFLNYAKPILRPLSDLTKEIEVNGEKFVPIEYFLGDDGDNILNAFNHNKNSDVIEYVLVLKLLEWHFDIYGLIEKGLAINKNTL